MSKQRFPGAQWAPIPESGEQGSYTKTQLIYHSTGTTASAAANRRYFASQNVSAESTFIVDYDGGCLQILEADERADANTTASRRAISVEVVGTADEPYTEAQVATLIAIGRWAVAEHPVAARQCPEHDASGIGWHVMFGAPGPWTTVRGKECPGPQRIAQVRDIIIPAVCSQPATTTQETDVDFAYETDDATLMGYSPVGKRRIEDPWEVGYWQRRGKLPKESDAAGRLKGVERASQSPDLAKILSKLPKTEA